MKLNEKYFSNSLLSVASSRVLLPLVATSHRRKREVSVIMRKSLTAKDGQEALKQKINQFKKIDRRQRDG